MRCATPPREGILLFALLAVLTLLACVLPRPLGVGAQEKPAAGGAAVLVEGTVDSPVDIDRVIDMVRGLVGRQGQVINAIEVAGPMQVQLECCIARVDRKLLRAIGFNFLQADTNNFIGSQIGNLIGVPAINVRGGSTISSGARTLHPGGAGGHGALPLGV